MSTLPDKFKAVIRSDATGKDVDVREVNMPIPKEDEVIVKIMATPCNPSDKFFLTGLYGFENVKPKPPVGTGLEGAGIVVATGSKAKDWLNRRVCCFSETFQFKSFMGNWGQYSLKNINDIFELPKEMDYELGCYIFVNPISTLGLLDYYQDPKKETAIIHLAANSAIGRSMAKICLKKKITLINIVHREEQVEYMKEVIGTPVVLNSSDPNFEKNMKEMIAKYRPSLVLDPVVGKVSDFIFHNLPLHAVHVIYGGLEGTGIQNVSGADCLMGCKELKGYWLSE